MMDEKGNGDLDGELKVVTKAEKESVQRSGLSSATEGPSLSPSQSPEDDASQRDNSAVSNSWGSWSSFMQKAASGLVNKSSALVEFMKKDLSEFTEAMQKDTAIIMSDATQSLKSKVTLEEANKAADLVKSGISSFFGSINASLSVFDSEADQSSEHQQTNYSRAHARLTAVQEDYNTFKKEPSGRPEDFDLWLATFDITKMRPEMDKLLDSVNTVQEAYNALVPLTVTHNEFWQRYFYKIHQLEVDERRIQSLMARSSDRTPEEMDWDDESEGGTGSVLLDPSEVSSVVSNESFQMVNHEPLCGREIDDAVLFDNAQSTSSRHFKQESLGSLGEWEQAIDSDDEKEKPTSESSRDEILTPQK